MTDEHTKADAAAKQQQEATKKHAEDMKKRLADERTAREKASKETAKTAGEAKPTPTQEENDLTALGVHLEEHEPDGSPPDLHVPPDVYGTLPQNKKLEADKPSGGYTTRTAQPKP
jgi:sRNA-binding protein